MIKEFKVIKLEIENAFAISDFEKVKKLLENCPIKNEFYYTASANYYYSSGEIDKGIQLLQGSLPQFANSFEVHYNLATLYSVIEKYSDAVLTFARASTLASSNKDKAETINKVNELLSLLEQNEQTNRNDLQKLTNKAQSILNEADGRVYPLNLNLESNIRKVVNESELTNLYRVISGIDNVDTSSRLLFKTELYKGEAHTIKRIDLKQPSMIPISFIDEISDISIQTPTKQYMYSAGTLEKNHYNYLRFEEVGEYTITSNVKVFVGQPLPLMNEAQSAKLVVSLFIDGLSGGFLKDNFEEYMPHTAKFFEQGFINENCYTTGDWTYPSISSLLTGKTTLKHGRHHPTNYYDFTKYNRIFFNDINQNGYVTAQFNSNWRMTPSYGYSEGMDRTVYQNYLGGFAAGEVLTETIEHIETFKNASQFVWVSLTDLHDVADEINDNFMSQVNTPAKYRQQKQLGISSVQTKFDESKIESYKYEMKRLDLHLSTFYNYVLSNFDKEDVIITLFSDHGQTYFTEEEFLLHEYRTNIPFMQFGKNIPQKKSSELCSIIDIFPTLLKQMDIQVETFEGRVLKEFDGEGRDFTVTETIHPNQPYLVSLKTSTHEYRFKTVGNVDNNCRVDLENYELTILDRQLGEIVSVQDDKYVKYILERAAVLQS